MDELHIPVRYTRGLKEIYFTSIPGLAGYLLDQRIVLSYGRDHWDYMPSTLIHEIGHHVDDQVHLSLDPKIIEEHRTRAKFMTDPYAKKSVVEYVGVGFETYYCGEPLDVAKMRRHNRVLFDRIGDVHRRFSAP